LPVVISFTLETDGRLPSGQSLAEALAQVDGETDARRPNLNVFGGCCGTDHRHVAAIAGAVAP
jgi:methionine synthase I (cobalamin-dependent)